MQLLLNILWAILGGGFLIALQYAIGGVVLCLTVVGIPFGIQCFKLAWLSLLPFGQDVVDDPASSGSGTLGVIMNILWLIFGGITTFLTHISAGLALAVTIIGIPFAMQHLKLAVLALFPFGRRIVEVR
ncbi:MAG: YccF domain-containing protein [Deltaproteobacteria bacterium]|nr:YccF domain-containing protein [Deltaproteobacteria bacterium]